MQVWLLGNDNMSKSPVIYSIGVICNGDDEALEKFHNYLSERDAVLMHPRNLSIKPSKGLRAPSTSRSRSVFPPKGTQVATEQYPCFSLY